MKKYLSSQNIGSFVSWGVFFILLTTYWLTVPPTVSYWDCPEYVAGAWKLEIGHPPGNPVWMLVERMVTMLAPSGKEAALFVNLSSGLLTAFAGFFLCRSIYMGAGWLTEALLGQRRYDNLIKGVAAATGGLAFGWCDSAWYSAVEAEVYAMSIFMTALCVWLMVKWAFCHDPGRSTRYLILLAYLFGLSVGIHQLNLLCIPALAMLWGIKRGVRCIWKVLALFFLSLAAVGCVLVGMMPSTIALAADFELLAVNGLGLPRLWGVAAYLCALGGSLLLALAVTSRSTNTGVLAASVFPAIFLSGIFIFGDNTLAGAAVCAMVSLLLARGARFSPRRLNICMWMLAMLLTGYASYAIIPIRGGIPFPSNPAQPGEPFSFAAYQAREQYGGAPLLHGHTPYSRNILREETDSSGRNPRYTKVALTPGHPVFLPKTEGAVIRDPYGMLSAEDSTANAAAMQRNGDAYIVKGYTVKAVTTPELDMWLPRITSRDPSDLDSFSDWAGADTSTMVRTPVSEAIDMSGNFVTRMNPDGTRRKAWSYRPTYMQSLRMFLTYQAGYMYFRYLLWNFAGRQNDVHSTGEVEHGNFITGFTPLDNAMLGAEHALPDDLGKENKGRNRYFLLPLALGIFGIIWLCRAGKRGQKICVVIFMLFLMTGLAIVVYLNQAPGEARERDYSFLGSYLAFAGWIGFGTLGLLRSSKRFAPAVAAIPVLTVCWMGYENFDDHDRSGRMAASNLTANLLNSLEKDAIIFVNGDNNTFPLWYALEVEGIRKDVRVINLAYLGLPRYAAMLMRDWDGAKAIPSVLRPEEIIYDALLFPRIAPDASDSVADACAAIAALASSHDGLAHNTRISLPIPGHGNIVYPLRKLSQSERSNSLEFRKLMILNILAANSRSEHPRPVYWQRSLSGASFIGLDSLCTPSLLARRLGRPDVDERERLCLEGLSKLQAPNRQGHDVYMDMIPASQISSQRASLILAAKDMLANGKTATAARIAGAADTLLGYDPRSYAAVINADTTFRVRLELASLLEEIADSLPNETDGARTTHLRARARLLRQLDAEMQRQYNRYKRTLPPHLRLKMSR